LDEDALNVLKELSGLSNRIDLNQFSLKVNLTPNETVFQFQQLAKEGFLQKVGNGYGITEKGKNALKVLTPVPEELGFQFYYGLNRPADLIVDSLEDFYIVINQINSESIEFHLYRGDFENWLKDSFKDPQLAFEFGAVRAFSLKGEELRSELLRVLDENYFVQQLL
jgi:hypothetical protein